MNKAIQLSLETATPITTATRLQVEANAICLQNTGDENITLDRQFTLIPGQSISFNASEDTTVILMEILVEFDGTGVNPLLEIIEVRTDAPGYGDYIPK